MRLAIVSTPRSGNTWLRRVFAGTFQCAEIAVHDYREIMDLPPDCAVQVHWHAEPAFTAWLTEGNFHVLTLARHPIDVLLSAVRFSQHDPTVARWLGGSTGLPIALGEGGSGSVQFLEYCLSAGAAALLSVTPDWWRREGVIRLRYEDAVAAPEATLRPVIAQLGKACERLTAVLESESLASLQATPNRHGWRGIPGHWSELVPISYATLIYERHRDVFQELSYPPPQMTCTTVEQASEAWGRLS